MASKMSWFPFHRSAAASFSSDPVDVGRNLEWLEDMLQDDKAWLGEVEARVFLDAQTEIEKKEIKDWAYDAEDVLDEWKFEQLRAQAEPAPAPAYAGGSTRGPVADLLMDPSFRHRVNDLKLRREEILEFNRMLRLGRPRGPRRQGKKVNPPPTSSLPGERDVHGRDDDSEMLVKFLMEGATEERLTVVPILGAAGVGKTTLAQKIYNDPVVSEMFLLGWVSASKGRQMMDLMKAFAESLVGGSCSFTQLEVIQDLLKQKIDGRRVLLVLDDVWYETIDGDQWEKLCATFRDCVDGSVIMLTTQDERVADKTKTVPAYILESLSGDLCWSVFRKHAFSGSLPTDDRLNKIGQKIAKECQGSPLVAKALGLRLRHEQLDTGAFVMPKLLHALAQFISDGECVTIENNNLCNLPRNDLQKALHLHTDIETLPNTISNLKHLRYLNLSGTKIEHADSSLFQLYNLQTLDFSCTNIKELPDTIGNLSNLLHLRLNVTKITELPESIGKLSKLQTLHLGDKESNNDVISNDDEDMEVLCLLSYQGVNDMADSSLNSLYNDDEDSSSNCSIMEENVCENLHPHTKVQQQDYLGGKLLMWMGNPSFSKLAHVCRSYAKVVGLVLWNRAIVESKRFVEAGTFPGDSLREKGVRLRRSLCATMVEEIGILAVECALLRLCRWTKRHGTFPSRDCVVWDHPRGSLAASV
ncbi:hypothetical protein Taro_049957 [Colocasia esculenta]|uniref:Uncharacterized protein n=1 Tax=Colocasia esculenta TaxID=4460 RepID=A0A843XCG6_COLES|nr:hypothetical protein [Colocasia esculenta]